MARHKQSKKDILRIITHYGIHIWAILIIANAALAYTYHFATHAASKETTAFDIGPSTSPSLSPSPSISEPPVSTGPVGPSLTLSFSVPGIGSGGGVMKPLHTTRTITVFLFAPDVNTLNLTVKPLYTIQGKAEFDTNPASPTYTSFVVPLLDLGSAVVEGNYQIAFRTDESLRTLIKQSPTDLGGEIFALSAGSNTVQIPEQTVLMGDTVPVQGDNVININDYNAFINCYGSLNTTNSFCKSGNYGDFNDDGVIDGIDYNILIRSLQTLAQEGQSTSIVPTPSTTPHKYNKITPKPTNVFKKAKPTPIATSAAQSSSNSGGAALGILSFFFLFIVIGVGVFLYFKNETVRTVIQSIIHISPTDTPAEPTDEGAGDQTEEQPEQLEQTTEESPTEEPAAEKEAAEETPPPAQKNIKPSVGGDSVEKDCYVKKKGPDEAGTGVWLTLTDDNGPMEAHYAKSDVSDGFAKVKGTMKNEKGKTYLEVSELSAEE